MPISPDEAAEVARRHGLSLADAAGLVNLANDVADADRIASRFAQASTDDDADAAARDFAARLFGRTPTPDPAPEPEPTPNTVPKEGTSPAIPDPQRDVRRFVADLFDHPDREHR